MKLGSLSWRMRNYGVIPTLKYLFMEFTFLKHSAKNQYIILPTLDSLGDLLKDEFQNKCGSRETINYVDEVFLDISAYFNNLEITSKSNFKFAVIKNEPTKTRLYVLWYLILNYPVTKIIESGTQHGLSALVIENALSLKKPDEVRFQSFDIRENVRPRSIGNAEYVLLNTPVRKNFKFESKDISSRNNYLLFFHDSDHSKENMAFEFNWAWKHLGAKIIVSDDVENNSAFLEFCKKNSISPFIIKLDNGPATGIAFRK